MQIQQMPLADQHAILSAMIAGARVRKNEDGTLRDPVARGLHSTTFSVPVLPQEVEARTDEVAPATQPNPAVATLDLRSGGKVKQITPQNVTKDNEPRHLRPWLRWSYASKGSPLVARMTTEGVRRLFALSDILESDRIYGRAPR